MINLLKTKRIFNTACIVGLCLLLAGCVDLASYLGTSSTPTDDIAEGTPAVRVSYLNVGQADSTLIKLPDGKYVLIDGGNVSDGALIADYLLSLGIDTLDIMVATHPHEDHIGGLDDVLAELDVKQVYMPELSENDTPTTKTYEYFLEAVIAEECDVYPATAGDILLEGEDYKISCLSPARTGIGDLNNYSAVIKLSFKDVSFLFTGDAEKEMEEEMLDGGYDVSATVLKVGHHGSSTSTHKDFLSGVDPDYAVISCGEDNSYGHPHDKITQLLDLYGVSTLRTDTDGTVHIISDGTRVSVNREPNLSLDGNAK